MFIDITLSIIDTDFAISVGNTENRVPILYCLEWYTLVDIVEKHAPEKSRVLTVRADKPWYTAELSAEKRLRRKCERKYKNTHLESDKLLLKEQRNKYNNLLNFTKKDYIKNKIENAQSSKDL